ncbi:MAG: hypothetical protein ABIQ18_05475 [Umezawaea sp.]
MSQREVTYAGLLPLRLRRWAKRLSSDVEGVSAALAELDARRFVVADHDAEEVLIRSLIRRDGIWKQPQVMAAAIRESFAITSPVLRGALAAELRRLPVEVTGPAPSMAATALLAGLSALPPAVAAASERRRRPHKSTAEPAAQADREQPPTEQPSPEPSRPAVDQLREVEPIEPAPNPSAKGSAKAQGEGGRGLGSLVPHQFDETPVYGVAPAREGVRTREDATRLVDEHVPGQPGKVRTRLVTEVAALLAEGVDRTHIGQGLHLWSGKRLGVGLLAEIVGEAVRAPVIDAARRSGISRADERVGSMFALAARYAVEDDDMTDIGQALRAAAEYERDQDGPTPLGALMAGVAA